MKLADILKLLWKSYFPSENLLLDHDLEIKLENIQIQITEQENVIKDSIKTYVQWNDEFLARVLSSLIHHGFDQQFCKIYYFFREKFRKKFKLTESSIDQSGYGYILVLDLDLSHKILKCGARTSHQRGWKFHLSFDDVLEGNLQRAWEIVLGFIFEYQIARTKVKALNVADESLKPWEVGKQVTFYAGPETLPAVSWSIFLKRLTHVLEMNGIKPGLYGEHVKYINQFVGYRYDELNRRYRESNEGPYKPEEVVDPFEHLFKNSDFGSYSKVAEVLFSTSRSNFTSTATSTTTVSDTSQLKEEKIDSRNKAAEEKNDPKNSSSEASSSDDGNSDSYSLEEAPSRPHAPTTQQPSEQAQQRPSVLARPAQVSKLDLSRVIAEKKPNL